MTIARFALLLPFVALAGCQAMNSGPATQTPTAPATTPPSAEITAAASGAALGTLQRPAGSRSVAQLDASAAEKAAASKPTTAGQKLGTTVASLGDATQGGFWIKTPLVKSNAKGRVVNPATGKSVNVDMIPLGGPASAGSQVSLPALTTLGADLTDLPELEVYSS